MSSNVDQQPSVEQEAELELDPAPYRQTRIVSAAQGIAAIMESAPPQAKKIPNEDSEDKLASNAINIGLLL